VGRNKALDLLYQFSRIAMQHKLILSMDSLKNEVKTLEFESASTSSKTSFLESAKDALHNEHRDKQNTSISYSYFRQFPVQSRSCSLQLLDFVWKHFLCHRG
jgi:hypothetical protein